jgi:monomeric isocitrate dehydrogenase
VRWVEVVEAEAVAVVVLAVAADAGRAGWVALRPLDPVVTVFAPTAGIESHTSSVSLVTRKSAHSAARR